MKKKDIKILLVDDEQDILEIVGYNLAQEGYQIVTASNGKEAIVKAKKELPHLIIMDVMMPEMDGMEACENIRKIPELSHVIITFLTARSEDYSQVAGFDAGADDYIIKPFDFRELLVRIRALLKRIHTTVATGTLLQAGDLVMNLDSKQVTRNGQAISLTAKEFQLLEYFLRNKNRVVSRADIALQVWDIDFDTRTNVIDVYVNYLRKKIDKGFDEPLIHTQVGMGYVLKDIS